MWNQCHVVVSSFFLSNPYATCGTRNKYYMYILYLIFCWTWTQSTWLYAVKERCPTSIVFFTAFCCFDNVHMYTLHLLMQLHLMFIFHNVHMSRVTITSLLFISVFDNINTNTCFLILLSVWCGVFFTSIFLKCSSVLNACANYPNFPQY